MASSSRSFTRFFMCCASSTVLSTHRASSSGMRSSRARICELARMTESGVLSSCDASATKRLCCSHALAMGEMAHATAKRIERLAAMTTMALSRRLVRARSAMVVSTMAMRMFPWSVTALFHTTWRSPMRSLVTPWVRASSMTRARTGPLMYAGDSLVWRTTPFSETSTTTVSMPPTRAPSEPMTGRGLRLPSSPRLRDSFTRLAWVVKEE